MQFFEKYVRIKIEYHKILILMIKLSQKLDEINVKLIHSMVFNGPLTVNIDIVYANQ